MIFGWLRRRRRRKLLAQSTPEAWRPWLDDQPFVQRLSADERSRLEAITRVLVAETIWEGGSGLQVTEEMKVVIASQAALLILEIEHDYFEDVTSVIVHPTTYESPFEQYNAHGVATEGEERLGEAHYRGPIMLAWDSAKHGPIDPRDGHNLVWHEFAHRLDALDGFFNGTPLLHRLAHYDEWRRVMTAAFEQLQDDAHDDRKSVFDHYGATNEAEFFAVAVETFFEKPQRLQREQPEVYDALRLYFRQDPLARLRVG